MTRLRVHESARYLQQEDGSPFFYLGDTAWELFHRLTPDETLHYLDNRAAKGFTVIQAVALAEMDGLRVPNRQGDVPFEDLDPSKPVEAYWRHVDFVVREANQRGLFLGFLPTWGDKLNKRWGAGPIVFNPQNAREYGRFLGRRYAEADLIWILGGDRPVDEGEIDVWRAMAAGLEEGDGDAHLKTYHPWGGSSSSHYVHDEPWLDFNMMQSGHDQNKENWRMVAADYALSPTKPVFDGEPGYEEHKASFKEENPRLTAYDVRKSFYWSVFAGAHGYTYGCHNIWQMYNPELWERITWANMHWRDSLDLPGAFQVAAGKRLMLSKSYFDRVPDQALLTTPEGEGPRHVAATRAADGSWAMVYSPLGEPFGVDGGRLVGEHMACAWFDPRSGQMGPRETVPRHALMSFTPPSAGEDWVLVLDRAQ